MDIILASKSPRRIEILKDLGFSFLVNPSLKDEVVESFSSNEDLCMKLAKNKALEIYSEHKNDIVLGFDTLVFLGDNRLGKPKDENECIEMIKSLKNKSHEVITGGYIISKNYEKSFYGKCIVEFFDIDDDVILSYAKTSEPYDKAGAYAIQGFIGRFVKSVTGDYFSVIGLPKALTYKYLNEAIIKNK